MFLENMKNRWFLADMPTNFGTETTLTEQAVAFYEERAKGGAGAIVVRIENTTNFDVEALQDFVEKIHAYDCKVWTSCKIEKDIYATMQFVKDCGADGIQLAWEDADMLQKVEYERQVPILLYTDQKHNQKEYQKLENIIDGIVLKGTSKDCQKIKSGTKLSVIWQCDVITEQEATSAYRKKWCDGIASQKMFLVAPDFLQRWEQNKPYAVCCQCGVCTQAMQDKTPIHCPYCPETGREYLENQRRKIATRKEVIVTQGGVVGMYAAKKAAERGFLTTVFHQEKPQKGASSYEKYLWSKLQELGVKTETNQQVDATFLLDKKPYLTVFVHVDRYTVPHIPHLEDVTYTIAQQVLQYEKQEMKQFAKSDILLIGGNQQAVDTAIGLRKYTDGKIYMVEEKTLEEVGIANPNLLEELDEQKIDVIYGANIQQIQKDRICLQMGGQRYDWVVRKGCDSREYPIKIVVAGVKEEIDDNDAIMALMDERLSYAVVGENDEIIKGLEGIFELFSRFYLA